MEIKLGDLVKDRVTGFKGIAIGITEWLNGCKRITVQSQELKDGKPIDGHCFDIQQIELLKSGAVPAAATESEIPARKSTGGPMPSPKQF